MPVKTKAKSHSEYMRTTTHHNLTHIEKHNWHPSNVKLVLIFLGVVTALAIMIGGLAIEA